MVDGTELAISGAYSTPTEMEGIDTVATIEAEAALHVQTRTGWQIGLIYMISRWVVNVWVII